jgi:hypothetical protein
MSNVIDFQAKREERNKKNSKQIVIDTLEALIYQEVYQEATFDIVHDINYDKFLQLFTQPSQTKELE